MYNRKKFLQNIRFDNLDIDTTPLNIHNSNTTLHYIDNNNFSIDPLEQFINNEPNVIYQYMYNINKAMDGLKYKFSTGIRLEIAGRLTKRNTAERSISKVRYKGNIKNSDSSYKGLPATLVRGYEKSSVQYNFSSSKLRTGSFGVKS